MINWNFKNNFVFVVAVSGSHCGYETLHWYFTCCGFDLVCMYVCVFMALITTLVLCARSQDLTMSCQCVGYMSFSGLLDLRAEESRVVRQVKPPRCGEASITHLAGFEPKPLVR